MRELDGLEQDDLAEEQVEELLVLYPLLVGLPLVLHEFQVVVDGGEHDLQPLSAFPSIDPVEFVD